MKTLTALVTSYNRLYVLRLLCSLPDNNHLNKERLTLTKQLKLAKVEDTPWLLKRRK